MRILVTLGLAVMLSGCGALLREAKQPDGRPSPLGVLVPSVQGRCGTVIAGTTTKRICAPSPAESDSAEADATPAP